VQFPLIGGAYAARGYIASAQVSENLFAEPNPKDSPFPFTTYPASGLSVFADYTGVFPGTAQWVRGVYCASGAQFFAVIGSALFQQTGAGTAHTLVGIIDDTTYTVSMTDNGTSLVAVTPSGGWTCDLANPAATFRRITDAAFYGANRCDFIDTFLIFNKPGSQAFYVSDSNAVTFDPLYFAEKIGYNDILISIGALHDNIWLFGNVTTEIWFNSGKPDFPFERMPNTVLQFGCIAPDSVVVAGNAIYWLSQDRNGRAILLRGEGYQAKRVSTFAVESEWFDYPYLGNCQGMVYQQAGHEIVLLYFDWGRATWAYDTTTDLWHRRVYGPNRDAWLPRCVAHWANLYDAPPNDKNLVIAGDRQAPRLLEISRNASTDAGVPITRVRSWPHLLKSQKRISHTQFVAAMQPGKLNPDQVSLRFSDDGGATFGQPLLQTVNGATNGQYSWRRLGMARDRVYEISWTAQGETALNGAWIEGTEAGT
jgi:hypothetical protein